MGNTLISVVLCANKATALPARVALHFSVSEGTRRISPSASLPINTSIVFRSCIILRNSVVAGNRTESPAGIYIIPGGLEGVRVRINVFIPIPIVVRIWQFTVHVLYSRLVLLRARPVD